MGFEIYWFFGLGFGVWGLWVYLREEVGLGFMGLWVYLREEVSNARGAHAHKHLDEFRPRNRKKRHLGLPGHRPC